MIRWTSNDTRVGPQEVTLLMTDGDRALVRKGGRDAWILAKHVHETKQEAFIAVTRARALHLWKQRLRVERRGSR